MSHLFTRGKPIFMYSGCSGLLGLGLFRVVPTTRRKIAVLNRPPQQCLNELVGDPLDKSIFNRRKMLEIIDISVKSNDGLCSLRLGPRIAQPIVVGWMRLWPHRVD